MVVQGAPQDTVALTPEMTPLFPDPTATLTLGHLPEIPVMAPQNQATTLLPKAPPPARPGKRSGLLLGILVGGGVVIVLAAIGFYGYQVGWFGERVPPQEIVTALPRAEVTPAIRPYLERAEAGDVTAMQMLGYFYCYGLNVTQNREEALRWYHKAADAGSVSAQKELANLEGKSAKE